MTYGEGYAEVLIDLEGLAMVKTILDIVKPISNFLVIDLAFVIEGRQESELPERILGSVRVHRINLAEKRLLAKPPAPE